MNLIIYSLAVIVYLFFLFLDLYNDNQVIIIYIFSEQAKKLITLEWFQIDVSFKQMKGKINKFIYILLIA